MQPGHPSDPIGQPGLGQPASRLVLDLDVVMVLRPVVSDEQQSVLPSLHTDCVRVSSLRENYQRPNEQVLTPLPRRARHPISGQSSRPPAGARSHIRTTAASSAFKCSPASGYQDRVCPTADSAALISAFPLAVERARIRSAPMDFSVDLDSGGRPAV